MSELLTARELVALLKIPMGNAWRLGRERKIPGVARVGEFLRFDRGAIEGWLAAGRSLADSSDDSDSEPNNKTPAGRRAVEAQPNGRRFDGLATISTSVGKRQQPDFSEMVGWDDSDLQRVEELRRAGELRGLSRARQAAENVRAEWHARGRT